MNTSAFLKAIRITFCLALVFAALATSARADDIPKFTAPEVNAFVQKYIALTNAYDKAAADKDEAKMGEIITNATDLLAVEGLKLDPKITTEERPAFERLIQTRSAKMAGEPAK